jgi:hypothetical protein
MSGNGNQEVLNYYRNLTIRCCLDRRRRQSIDEEQFKSDAYLELKHNTNAPSDVLRSTVRLALVITRTNPKATPYELVAIVNQAVYLTDEGDLTFDKRAI